MPEHDNRRDPLGLVRGGEGAITGTVVCAAAIAAGSDHLVSIGRLSLLILGTIAIYWIAHLHAITIGSALTHRHHPLAAFQHALVETLPIAGASVVPLAVLLAATLLGADVRTAAWWALIATIILLTAYSYVAGMRSGLGIRGRLASAVAGAGVGMLVIVLKAALH